MHAWRARDGGLVCYDDQFPGGGSWSGRIISLDLYFARHVGERSAVDVASSVLPADAMVVGTFDGVNNDVSAIRDGTCRSIVYTSQTLAAAVKSADPSWSGDPAKATITLYSGRADSANGSDKPYNLDSLNEVLILIGAENRGPDGLVTC